MDVLGSALDIYNVIGFLGLMTIYNLHRLEVVYISCLTIVKLARIIPLRWQFTRLFLATRSATGHMLHL